MVSLTDWVVVPDVRRVVGVGFWRSRTVRRYWLPYLLHRGMGLAKPGASYSYGIWQSVNFDQPKPTWTKLTDYPAGNFDAIKDVDGDPNYYGVCYMWARGLRLDLAPLGRAILARPTTDLRSDLAPPRTSHNPSLRVLHGRSGRAGKNDFRQQKPATLSTEYQRSTLTLTSRPLRS